MKTRRMCKAERLSFPLDRISTLPQPIIETILCFLPTKAAARTSILSKEWRYYWTTVPKLDLSHYKQHVSHACTPISRTNKRCKRSYVTNQILLRHKGPIHDLTLYLPKCHCSEWDQIILRLSRNITVKKLTLTGWDFYSRCYKLPISIFSFRHLTHLDLSFVDIDHPPIFNGFGSLRSLCLHYVRISSKTLLHLLSNCPSLKSLVLLMDELRFGGKCTINKLFECLPVLEHLTIWPHVSKWLLLDAVSQELTTSLAHLKYFCLNEICHVDTSVLDFLVLIKCLPNLEKVKLVCDLERRGDFVVWEDYSNVWLEHLKELEIECHNCSIYEIDFVKFILGRSPKLKKVRIRVTQADMVNRNQELEMLKTLLQAACVSPAVMTVW